jgi:IS30 family transposase
MTQLPDHLRRSLTWDQGKEMSNHLAIAEAAELDIYLCDPHSPWQLPVATRQQRERTTTAVLCQRH